MKYTFLKIIAFALCGAILVVSMVAFKIETHAEDVGSTVYITGDDLYALLSAGIWEVTATINGLNVQLSKDFWYTDGDGNFICVYDESNQSYSQDFSNIKLSFSPVLDYENVVEFSIISGAVMSYITMTPNGGGPISVQAIKSSASLTYPNGVIVFDDVVPNSDFTIPSPIVSNPPCYTSLLTASFEPITITDFIVSHSFSISKTSSTDTKYYIYQVAGCVNSILIRFAAPSDMEVLQTQIKLANEYLSKIDQSIKDLDGKLSTSTDEDKTKLDDMQSNFDDVKDKADEYNEAMDSVDTPEPEEVLPEDSVSDIMQDEHVSEGQPYIFSILESLQSITWILTMILISVTVGIIKYIIYGKS